MKDQGYISRQQCLALVSCLCLFMGIGRIFSLVASNPVLGYANNYDMIRLQACHQIWPADKIVNITTGTPSAPLRRYTLDKHVDTPCFPSSELLFTGIGIELAKLKNLATGESLVSIKTIGFVKAIFLALTLLLASVYFHRKNLYPALLANGLVTLLVLSDPGVTLYMNTFYTEFSAIYFLYLALIGVVVLAQSGYRPAASWVLLAGLVGLGFSKPQHMVLALSIGALLSIYLLAKKYWKPVPLLLTCAMLPLLLQAGNWYAPRNESMIRTDNINLVGSLLNQTPDKNRLLSELGLPDTCKLLQGKTGYDTELQKIHYCPEVDSLRTSTALSTLIHHPRLLIKMAVLVLEQQKNWVFDLYGHVEQRRNESVSNHRITLGSLISEVPRYFFSWLLLGITAIAVIITVAPEKFSRNNYLSQVGKYLLLLAGIQAAGVLLVILQGGTVGANKNMHLYLPVAVTAWLTLLACCIALPEKSQPSTR